MTDKLTEKVARALAEAGECPSREGCGKLCPPKTIDGCCAYEAAEAAITATGVRELLEALTEIAKGEGEFATDPLQHAINTIESMKALAHAAIAKVEA